MNLFTESTAREISLYDYQEVAVEALRENMRNRVMNQVLCAPTGSGKTEMALHLIKECQARKKRAVFLCDRISLIQQTSDRMLLYGIDHGVIQGNHRRYRPDELIQVASPQTLANRRWPDPLDLIVVDECHTSRKTTHDRIRFRGCYTIGLTATPFTKGMGKLYDGLVNVTTTHKLIEDGWLSTFKVFAPSEPDMTGAKVTAGEWTTKEASKRSIPIVGDLVKEYLKHAEGRKFICFGADIAHCEVIQRQFQAAGIQVGLYCAHTPDSERSTMIEEFRKPKPYLQGLVSVAALSKGFDVNDVSCIIMARPLRKSFAEHLQIFGRGIRRDPADPDKCCIILDHTGNMVRFWDQMVEFFDEGAKELDDGKKKDKAKAKPAKEAQGRKCPKCHAVHMAAPNCPNCGYEYPKRQREHKDGTLTEFGRESMAPREIRVVWHAMLIWIQEDRGYDPGWVYHKFKERFGVQPLGIPARSIPPTREVLNWVKSRQIAWAKSQRRK